VKVEEDMSGAYVRQGVAPTAFTGVVWTKIIHCIVPHQIHGAKKSKAIKHEENTTIGFVDGIYRTLWGLDSGSLTIR